LTLAKTFHPEYASNQEYWQDAWDFYRGGKWVLEPVHRALPLRRRRLRRFVRGTDREDANSTNDIPSYLFGHIREENDQYLDRHDRAFHIPIFRTIVDIYVSATLRRGPTRTRDKKPIPPDEEPWKAFRENCDLVGTNIDPYMRQALTLALVYGKIFAITDMPAMPEGDQKLSKQKAAELGIRPYTYLVSPLDVVDWSLDEFGRLNWLVIREDRDDGRQPGDEVKRARSQFKVWTKDKWFLYQSDQEPSIMLGGNFVEEGFKVVKSGDNKLKRVPARILFARRSRDRRRSLEADSMLADLVPIDLGIFNRFSLLDEQLYGQAFSQLAVPLGHGQQTPEVTTGVERVFGFNGENGAPLYISPASDIIRVHMDGIDRLFEMARQTSGVSRGSAEVSKESRSAAAINLESQDKHNAIAMLAEHLEEFDRGIYQDIAEWNDLSPEDAPQARYHKDVTLKSVSNQITDALKLMQMQVTQTAMKEIAIPIFERVLKEHGASEAAMARARKAIEKASKEQEEFKKQRNELILAGGTGEGVGKTPKKPDTGNGKEDGRSSDGRGNPLGFGKAAE
jgi:hypothetical protein